MAYRPPMERMDNGVDSSGGGEMERMAEAAALVRLRSRRVFRSVLALIEATAIELSPTALKDK